MPTAACGVEVRLAGCRPWHAKTVSQVVRNTPTRFVGSLPYLLGLDLLERHEELLLILLCQAMVGSGKQAEVLLANVLPEQLQVTVPVLDKPLQGFGITGCSRFDRGVHALDIEATKFMFTKHDHHRTTPARETVGLHHGEELGLFLTVMAAVGSLHQRPYPAINCPPRKWCGLRPPGGRRR